MSAKMEPMEQHRHERVLIETSRHRIEGTITLARDGYRSRNSDVLNASEKDFLALTDVTVAPVDGTGTAEEHVFVIVARAQIVLVIPRGEGRPPVDGAGTLDTLYDGASRRPPPLTSV
jgi:hypothetical protein